MNTRLGLATCLQYFCPRWLFCSWPLAALLRSLCLGIFWILQTVLRFQYLSRFQRFVWDMFAVFSFVMLLRWCPVQFLAFRAQLSTSTTPSYDSSARPSVSILVPAYQEAENIESTLRSLVELEYPRVGLVYQKKTRCFSVSQLAERYCSLKDDLFAIEAEGLKRKAQAETR
jgi:hypothetical protein